MKAIEIMMQNCGFEELRKCFQEKNKKKEIWKEVERLGIVEEKIVAYYYCVYMTNQQISAWEKSCFHKIAMDILVISMNFLETAYSLAFYHINEAMKLCPDNLEYKLQTIAIFSDIPDFEPDQEKMSKVAQEILAIDSQNQQAIAYLKNV